MGVGLDDTTIFAGKAKAPVLGPFTIRRALSTFCDITTRPRQVSPRIPKETLLIFYQSFLREIAQYAHDDEDKARLLRLGNHFLRGEKQYLT